MIRCATCGIVISENLLVNGTCPECWNFLMGIKPYCTQNEGECESCSLVNHGLDCMNNEL